MRFSKAQRLRGGGEFEDGMIRLHAKCQVSTMRASR